MQCWAILKFLGCWPTLIVKSLEHRMCKDSRMQDGWYQWRQSSGRTACLKTHPTAGHAPAGGHRQAGCRCPDLICGQELQIHRIERDETMILGSCPGGAILGNWSRRRRASRRCVGRCFYCIAMPISARHRRGHRPVGRRVGIQRMLLNFSRFASL